MRKHYEKVSEDETKKIKTDKNGKYRKIMKLRR